MNDGCSRKSPIKKFKLQPRFILCNTEYTFEYSKLIRVSKISSDIYKLKSYNDYLSLKDYIEAYKKLNQNEIISHNNKNSTKLEHTNYNNQTNEDNSKQPEIKLIKKEEKNINTVTNIFNQFNSEFTKEIILVLEINEKKLQIEANYDKNHKFITIKFLKDLDLVLKWIYNNLQFIELQIIVDETHFVIPDKTNNFYKGYLKCDKQHGFGYKLKPNGLIEYVGDFFEGDKHGFGCSYTRSGLLHYRGEFDANVKNGIGFKVCHKSNRAYIGHFKHDIENGWGSLYQDNYVKLGFTDHYMNEPDPFFNESFIDDNIFDRSIYCKTFRYKLIQEGDWCAGRPHGFGRKYDELGFKTYEGSFRAGIPVYENYLKPMKHYYPNKRLKYVGGQRQHYKHGFGTKYDKHSNVMYNGGFRYNDYSGVGIEYSYSIFQNFKNFVKGICSSCCCCKFKSNRIVSMKDPRLSASSGNSRPENTDLDQSVSNPTFKLKNSDQLAKVKTRQSFAISSKTYLKQNFEDFGNDNFIYAPENEDMVLDTESDENDQDVTLKKNGKEVDNGSNIEADFQKKEFFTIQEINLVFQRINELQISDKILIDSKPKPKFVRFGFYLEGSFKQELEFGNKDDVTFQYFTRLFYCNGEIMYQGYILHGRKHGKGKFYYNNKKNSMLYSGDWYNDKPHREGTLYTKNGYIIYHGEVNKGKVKEIIGQEKITNFHRIYSVIEEEEGDDHESEYLDIISRQNFLSVKDNDSPARNKKYGRKSHDIGDQRIKNRSLSNTYSAKNNTYKNFLLNNSHNNDTIDLKKNNVTFLNDNEHNQSGLKSDEANDNSIFDRNKFSQEKKHNTETNEDTPDNVEQTDEPIKDRRIARNSDENSEDSNADQNSAVIYELKNYIDNLRMKQRKTEGNLKTHVSKNKHSLKLKSPSAYFNVNKFVSTNKSIFNSNKLASYDEFSESSYNNILIPRDDQKWQNIRVMNNFQQSNKIKNLLSSDQINKISEMPSIFNYGKRDSKNSNLEDSPQAYGRFLKLGTNNKNTMFNNSENIGTFWNGEANNVRNNQSIWSNSKHIKMHPTMNSKNLESNNTIDSFLIEEKNSEQLENVLNTSKDQNIEDNLNNPKYNMDSGGEENLQYKDNNQNDLIDMKHKNRLSPEPKSPLVNSSSSHNDKSHNRSSQDPKNLSHENVHNHFMKRKLTINSQLAVIQEYQPHNSEKLVTIDQNIPINNTENRNKVTEQNLKKVTEMNESKEDLKTSKLINEKSRSLHDISQEIPISTKRSKELDESYEHFILSARNKIPSSHQNNKSKIPFPIQNVSEHTKIVTVTVTKKEPQKNSRDGIEKGIKITDNKALRNLNNSRQTPNHPESPSNQKTTQRKISTVSKENLQKPKQEP